MTTLIFCTSYADTPSLWHQRYRKWVDYFADSGLEFDQMLVVDDGSPILPQWTDFDVLTEFSAQRPKGGRVLHHFSNNLGRQGILHYPGWYRSFGFAAQYAKAHQFTKVIHVESDAYLISPRIVDFINDRQTGWTTFWCPRWKFEESAIQVICQDQLEAFFQITQQDYASVYAGKLLDRMLPYTSVRKDFVGDRYAEGDGVIPPNVDYICQFPTPSEMSGSPKVLGKKIASVFSHQQSDLDVTLAFAQGLSEHNQGQLQRAKELYRAVLNTHAQHFDALHMLGVVEMSLGNYREAVNLIKQALTVNPNLEEAHYNLGLALDSLNEKVKAIESYDNCLRLNPKNFKALNNKGKSLLEYGHYALAQDACNAAIELKPDYAAAYFNLGNALKALQQNAAALACYDKAIALRPDDPRVHLSRGCILQDLNHLNDAISSFERAQACNPDFYEAYFHAGNALAKLKRPNDALANYKKAIHINPQFANAFINCANTQQELRQFDAALASYDEVIRLNPSHFLAFSNRARPLLKLNRLDEALSSCDQAIKLKPDHAETHNRRGVILKELHQFDASLRSYDTAIRLEPRLMDSYWNKSLTHLLCGEFELGWSMYEYRWQISSFGLIQRKLNQPLWLGKESLASKTILLHSEQGLGDTLQFCRYAKQVKALGARVVMEVPAPLLELLKSLEGVDVWVEQGKALPDFDCHCPMMSLPMAFKTELYTIPCPEPYLRSDSGKVAKWQTKLGAKTKPRIGLVWSGRSTHDNDHNRSVLLNDLMAHLPQGFDYVCLQQEIREADQAALSVLGIQFFGQDLKDFSETAALCELMDLVISVDTSVAHLAAALGQDTWVLLPYVPDWRWLLDRDDSPWYGCVRLFRQEADRSWSRVLEQVGRLLLKDKRLLRSDEAFPLTQQPLQSKAKRSLKDDEAQQFELGLRLHQQGQLPQAKEIYEKVLSANPLHFDAIQNLGVIALTSNQPELACRLIRQALVINPLSADAHFNFGLAAHANKKPLSAIESFDQALAIHPSDSKLYWNKSLALLLSGQFDEGWRLYEYGWQGSQQRGTPRTYPQPLWLGTDPLVGKTILLHSEQGLGDTLQFCRYVRLVQARGARVMMEVPAPLLPLLESLEGVDEFIVQGQPLPDFDCHCPLMSLPLAFKTDINTIPCPEPYLRSDSAKVAQWKTKLGAKTKPRIGIVWSGRREHRNDHNRSVALLDLMAHLPQAFDYVCLQQEIREADQKALNTSGIQFFGGELKDFSDTAALCDVMDLVISVDTSVAHLAAALGKTTWVLLPYVPDWRWLLDRLDSPWYASVKLWRQQEDRQWGSVLSHIANELRDFAEARVGHESAGIISPCPLPPKFSSVSMP